jgi:hypothetical protein
MENLKDNIGELFSNAFEKHEIIPEGEEWDMLSATLQKRNFFRFNATQFNVYYASTIVFCFLVCAGVGSHYTYTNFIKLNKQVESSLATPSDSSIEAITKQKISVENQEAANAKSTSLPLVESKNAKTGSSIINKNDKVEAKENQVLETVSETVKRKDSVHVQATIPVHKLVSKDSIKAKPKRILYITKQDTILKFDTLHAPKQKKKWFK